MEFITPDWPCHEKVKAFSTTRLGGVSPPPYDSLNLGHHVGDELSLVTKNRLLLPNPDDTLWLSQVHGIGCVEHKQNTQQYVVADSAFTVLTDKVCGVMTADCAPILLSDRNGTCVAAIHAGWRGLAAGVVQNCVDCMPVEKNELLAWIGPCIGSESFEVGTEVVESFAHLPECFEFQSNGKFLADLTSLCAKTLTSIGIKKVFLAAECTYSSPKRFFSHRHTTHRGMASTGRMFTGIYLSDR